MATDMRKPPGVSKLRNRAAAAMASIEWTSADASPAAKPRSSVAPSASCSRAGGGPNRSPTASGRVMEDDTERVAAACAQPADPMPHGDAAIPARPAHRTLIDREDDAFALR